MISSGGYDLATAPWDGERGTASLHQARAELLEVEVRFQRAVDDVLSVMLAGSAHSAALLRDALAPLSAIRRLDLLDDLFGEHDLHDAYPFVMPVGRALVDVRNAIAHGEAVGWYPDELGGVHSIDVESYWRGRARSRRIRVAFIEYLAVGGRAVTQDLLVLWAIEGALLPGFTDEVEPFDEG